ncbi:MAG: glycosyltransferase [Thermodesulfobacteriota bacterium]
MRVWVVLPAYNEGGNLGELFEGFKQTIEDTYNLDLRVIVIDDGSTDNTSEVILRHAGNIEVQVLRNESNLGLATAFMRGMTTAANQAEKRDVIICMDADNSHVPGQILRMLRKAREGLDVVISSRYQPESIVRGVPIFRRILSRGMSLLFRFVYPISGVRDYSCSYRAYRAGLIQDALKSQGRRLFCSEGFACMVGILLRLSKAGAVFGETPIVLRYDQKRGNSKINVRKTIFTTIHILLRERFCRS